MSKTSEIREICGDYALDIEYSAELTFTMFFNSRRNAETVKRCIEVDDSVPNVATAVDFVEVVRCRDCQHYEYKRCQKIAWIMDGYYQGGLEMKKPDDFCSCGERKAK